MEKVSPPGDAFFLYIDPIDNPKVLSSFAETIIQIKQYEKYQIDVGGSLLLLCSCGAQVQKETQVANANESKRECGD